MRKSRFKKISKLLLPCLLKHRVWIMHCVQVQKLGVTLYSIFILKLVQLKGTEHEFKEGDWIKRVEHEFLGEG